MRSRSESRPSPALDPAASATAVPTTASPETPLDSSMSGAPVGEVGSLPVDERRQLAGRILADALLLGIVGDALLRVPSWGVNLALWSIGIVAALLTLARRRHDSVPDDARWVSASAIALGLMFAWRDTADLAVYNALALAGTLLVLATAIAHGPGFAVAATRVRDLVQSGLNIGIGTLFGMLPLVFSDVSLRDVAQSRGTARVIVGVRAALIAIPLLLVFGGLFASADPVFARIAGDALRIDAEKVASHLIMTGGIAWVVGGFLRATVLGSPGAMLIGRIPDVSLGLTEVSVALGSLVILFAAFVAVQLRYFFGGDALVQATAGMSYAEYARRGFFELVAVAALVLPVLLAANVLLRRDTAHAQRTYRALSLTLLGLLAVIMYSAFARMQLYQAVYGFSTDRLYATVFMAWLVVVFGWFAVTVLREREARFLIGVLVSAWGFLAGLNTANPAAWVARANIARAERGKELDVHYLTRLGADAVPALTRYLVTKPLTPPFSWPRAELVPSDTGVAAQAQRARDSAQYVTSRDDYTAQCYAARALINQWGRDVSTDWRSWTLGRAKARRVIAANEASLRQLAHLPAPGQPDRPCPTPAVAAETSR